MDADDPGQRWSADRSETPTERLDRNWANLLQETRVVQTGVQLLTGFLLTLPFQQRFDRLDGHLRLTFLLTVWCAIGSTVFLVAPVAIHRLVFRRRLLKQLVSTSHRFALVGITLLGGALVGVTIVVVDMVLDETVAFVSGGVVLAAEVVLWLAVPLAIRRRANH
ncbi:DUF6328 family protein [Mycobacterium sp. MYCO198283]|uniref:DUF6328 family protein n=1 Tax=Mycobacterium sp. MYCO198283 TaxID=2883505 RepID=UPI001E50A757|nr:DUF6328 family protein [Mycobacterium sp. MYCO198283]MCG5431026.1 DUF6328 family protein [Mycobacterium sp. MYCO198283]